MLRRPELLLWLLVAIVSSRLITMALVPMVETTEPRYAEIARIMAETGDWITPWFDYGVPFWGKPPLSFWLEALSFRLFGVTEFAARLPSWLAHLATLGLIYTVIRNLSDHRQALIGTLIYSSMGLSFTLSGAVLTDPFLALGTTLSFVSIILALKRPDSQWRWWFFVGLSIGLLAKGPLVLVLTGGPLFLWLLWRRQWRDLGDIPWVRGMLLTVLLSLPWYIAAEMKTPGFIDYFIVGEHFLRFVDPGWSGDLYGSAHKRAFGTIWIYWIGATFPWGPIAATILIWRWITRKTGMHTPSWTLSDEQRLMLLAAIFPSIFFTFAGNILSTYQLPALAPLAMLTARLVANSQTITRIQSFGSITAMLVVPLMILLAGLYTHIYTDTLNSEKTLVAYYDEHKGNNSYPLIYIGKAPFSARFYSLGQIKQMELAELEILIGSKMDSMYFVALPDARIDNGSLSLPGRIEDVFRNKNFTLLQIQHTENRIVSNKME